MSSRNVSISFSAEATADFGGFIRRLLILDTIETYRNAILIYNPVAGKLRRDGERFIERSKRALGKAGVRPQFWATAEAGAATELARRAVREGADLVLAAGGDG